MFQARVGGKFAALCIFDSDVDTLASSLKEGQLSTAEEVLWRQRKKIEPWVTNELLDLCDQRRQLKQQKYTNTEAALESGKKELRSLEEDEGSKGRVDQGAVQEYREGNNVRKQQTGLRHPQGSHQNQTA